MGTINTRTGNIDTSIGSASASASQTGATLQAKTKYIANTIASMNTTLSNINTNVNSVTSNVNNMINMVTGVKIIRHMQNILIQAGVQEYSLSGFTNAGKMIVIFAGGVTSGGGNTYITGISSIATTKLTLSTAYSGNANVIMQVIEFY